MASAKRAETPSEESTAMEDHTLISCDTEKDKQEGFCSQWITTKTSRLASMLTLILVYFLAEVIVGYITNSLTLVADSFHMLSDCLSLIVALIAVRMSKRAAHESITPWPSKTRYYNTFGWVRFEVVGALINSTFLLALCVSILMEAVEKFYHPELVSQPLLVLGVGAGGLVINIIGLILFGSHTHGGHDHNHGHSHDHDRSPNKKSKHIPAGNGTVAHVDIESNQIDGQNHSNVQTSVCKTQNKISGESQMNMRAVFLHVLGDALGSVIVMISATTLYFVPHEKLVKDTDKAANATAFDSGCKEDDLNIENRWILYLDPVMSLLLILIMICTTVPLFKQSSFILLQTVPNHIELDDIKERIEQIEGVQEIHDFHIWQLAGDKLVATIHLQCKDAETYLVVAKEVKRSLHDAGIHSSTVQPEFHTAPVAECNMMCDTAECKTKTCCSVNSLAKRPSTSQKQQQYAVEEMNESATSQGKGPKRSPSKSSSNKNSILANAGSQAPNESGLQIKVPSDQGSTSKSGETV